MPSCDLTEQETLRETCTNLGSGLNLFRSVEGVVLFFVLPPEGSG